MQLFLPKNGTLGLVVVLWFRCGFSVFGALAIGCVIGRTPWSGFWLISLHPGGSERLVSVFVHPTPIGLGRQRIAGPLHVQEPPSLSLPRPVHHHFGCLGSPPRVPAPGTCYEVRKTRETWSKGPSFIDQGGWLLDDDYRSAS